MPKKLFHVWTTEVPFLGSDQFPLDLFVWADDGDEAFAIWTRNWEAEFSDPDRLELTGGTSTGENNDALPELFAYPERVAVQVWEVPLAPPATSGIVAIDGELVRSRPLPA